MPDLLDKTKEQLRARLDELRPLVDEYKRLEGALEALDGVSTTAAAPARRGGGRGRGAGTKASSGTTRRRGRPRGSGNRAQQFLELVRSQPGITIPEAAKSMGIKPPYLYRVGPQLEERGEVRKEGKGYFPVEGGSAASTGQAASEAAAEPSAA